MIASIYLSLSLIRYPQSKCLFTDKCDQFNKKALCDCVTFLEVTTIELSGQITTKFLFISDNSTTFIDYATFHAENDQSIFFSNLFNKKVHNTILFQMKYE